MLRPRALSAAIAIGFTSMLGCIPSRVRTAEAPIAPPDPGQTHVPNGTPVFVRMKQTLSTADNEPGDEFTAVVVTPVVATDGRVHIPVGAIVRGRVVDVALGAMELTLGFDTVETDRGLAPMNAKVAKAEQDGYLMRVQTYRGMSYMFPLNYSVPIVYPPNSFYGPEVVKAIRVPEGALVRLVLDAPIVVPRAPAPPAP